MICKSLKRQKGKKKFRLKKVEELERLKYSNQCHFGNISENANFKTVINLICIIFPKYFYNLESDICQLTNSEVEEFYSSK